MTDITVVIPVWDDYVGYLPTALASLRDQGVPVAVLLVDNASRTPLPTGPAILRLPARASVGAARNAGLAEVHTPFVCFLDADDELLPGTLARMRERLHARPRAVVSVAASIAHRDGEIVPWPWPRPLAYRLCRHRRLFAALTALRNAYPTTDVLMRTAAIRDAGGFADADHEEDWRPAVALAARGHVDLDRRPGRRYRLSAGSLYGGGIDVATMRAARRDLRRALRADPVTRRAMRAAGWLVAAAHVAAAYAKARPGRNGHARLLSATGAARDAGHGPHEHRHVGA